MPPTNEPVSIGVEELGAFVDGALTAERRRAVEAHLASDEAAASQVSAYRTQLDLLHTLYDPVLEEPLPPRFAMPAAAAARGGWLGRAAAAVLLLALGAAAGWWLRGASVPPARVAGPDLAHQALVAYAVFSPEVRHPVEVGAAEEKHLVTWLSKRLQAPLKAPALGGEGYALVGGRLLSSGDGPAGLFMYENQQGGRLTLYVRRNQGQKSETAFRYVHENGIGVFYWIDRELSYALAGRLERDGLLALSRVVYEQIDR